MDYKIPDDTPESERSFRYVMACLDAVAIIDPDVVNYVIKQLEANLPETQQDSNHPLISYMHKNESIRHYTRQSIVVLQVLLLLQEHIKKREKMGEEISDEAIRLISMWQLMNRKDGEN